MSSDRPQGLSTPVKAWFLANAVALLLPPLHWFINDQRTPILGMPPTLLYFIALSTSIAASVVVAYLQESAAGEFQ